MGKGINPDIIKSREMARYLLLPVVADICCSYDYWTVCELMNDHFGNADADQRKEVVDMLVSVSESWNRGRLAKGGEIILKNEFSDVPRVQPVSGEQKEMESRLPMNEKQVEWLQRWAADFPDEAPDPKSMGAPSNDHYNAKDISKEQLQTIFERLINKGYIAPQTTFEQWQYVCTGEGENEPHTVITAKEPKPVMRLCSVLFYKSDADRIWKTASRVFMLLSTGKEPNPTTMKTDLNRAGGKERKSWQMIDKLLNV